MLVIPKNSYSFTLNFKGPMNDTVEIEGPCTVNPSNSYAYSLNRTTPTWITYTPDNDSAT